MTSVIGAPCWDPEVIRPRSKPLLAPGRGTVVLRGNLCPDGAVLKLSAATPELCRHRGRALVWEFIEDYNTAIDDEGLDVEAADVLVVRGCGPRGYPGMPEVGNLAIPKRLLRQGVRDMVRVSDARMSGTSYGTVVLHVSPESDIGGPLALVRTGDIVSLDVEARRLDIEVDAAELDRRRAAWRPVAHPDDAGYVSLYRQHVLQAHLGRTSTSWLGRAVMRYLGSPRGEVAWITGAGSGTGAPYATRLGPLGASVAVVDRAFDAGQQCPRWRLDIPWG